jgi:hypothetical protein
MGAPGWGLADQPVVQANGFFGDAFPELLEGSLSSGLAESATFGWVVDEFVDFRGQVAGAKGEVDRRAAVVRAGFERDEAS